MSSRTTQELCRGFITEYRRKLEKTTEQHLGMEDEHGMLDYLVDEVAYAN